VWSMNPREGAQVASGRRWSVERRLELAENRLYWDGTLNRDDLMRAFGVSANQASADLSQLRERHGEAIAYNTVLKRYEPREGFAPQTVSAAALLNELRLIAEGQLDAEAGTLAAPPALAIAEAPTRSVDPAVLRAVLAAIRERTVLEADYVSFQRPGVLRRRLSPHALVFDGFRWHVRAHDTRDEQFKDFVIARLAEPARIDAPATPAEEDADWLSRVTLHLAPHPQLSEHQKAVTVRDYGMDESGTLRLVVRKAVAFYARKRLGLLEGHEERPAHEQHIILTRMEPT